MEIWLTREGDVVIKERGLQMRLVGGGGRGNLQIMYVFLLLEFGYSSFMLILVH